jgi:hypothetical protein
MSTNKRSGKKWTINEILSLQREYELLEWTIQEIAEKHQRSETAILFKLESEGLINSWEHARGFASLENFTANDDEDQDEECDDQDCCSEENFCESKITKLNKRVSNLENNMSELTIAVNKLCDNIISNKTSKQYY